MYKELGISEKVLDYQEMLKKMLSNNLKKLMKYVSIILQKF